MVSAQAWADPKSTDATWTEQEVVLAVHSHRPSSAASDSVASGFAVPMHLPPGPTKPGIFQHSSLPPELHRPRRPAAQSSSRSRWDGFEIPRRSR